MPNQSLIWLCLKPCWVSHLWNAEKTQTLMVGVLYLCYMLTWSPSQHGSPEALTAGTDLGASSAASGRASGCWFSCPSPCEPALYSSTPPPAFSCCCGSPPPATAARLNRFGSWEETGTKTTVHAEEEESWGWVQLVVLGSILVGFCPVV